MRLEVGLSKDTPSVWPYTVAVFVCVSKAEMVVPLAIHRMWPTTSLKHSKTFEGRPLALPYTSNFFSFVLYSSKLFSSLCIHKDPLSSLLIASILGLYLMGPA